MRRLKSSRNRRAAVAVEMAVISPVMFSILFGIIEFGWLFTVRHTMVNAAREGARLGALPSVTGDEVEERTMQFLEPLGIDDISTVTVTEPTEEDPTVTVLITAPRSSVSLVGNFFGWTSGTIEGTASMRREGM
ncbi:MAG: TadE/TadG family type IV pilus assembly protein [Phycisphaerae bacterium]